MGAAEMVRPIRDTSRECSLGSEKAGKGPPRTLSKIEASCRLSREGEPLALTKAFRAYSRKRRDLLRAHVIQRIDDHRFQTLSRLPTSLPGSDVGIKCESVHIVNFESFQLKPMCQPIGLPEATPNVHAPPTSTTGQRRPSVNSSLACPIGVRPVLSEIRSKASSRLQIFIAAGDDDHLGACQFCKPRRKSIRARALTSTVAPAVALHLNKENSRQ